MNQIPTYLINLARSHDRKVAMQEQLTHLPQLDLSIVSAIDGATLSNTDLNIAYNSKKAMQFLYRDMTPPEIGCALSHMECYRTLLASHSPFALILEDDITFARPALLNDYAALSRIMNTDKPTIILCTPNIIIKTHTKQRINHDITIANYFSGVLAAGYFINRAAAKHLVDHFYPVYCLADSWRHFKVSGIQLWALVPPAIQLHPISSFSTIEKNVLKPLQPRRQKSLMESLRGSLYRLYKKLGLKLGILERTE